MPQYKYQTRASGGATQTGVLQADNAMVAAQTLRAKGLQVLQLAPMSEQSASLFQKLKQINDASSSGPSQRDIVNFTTQLAVMIRAGISIRAAIEGIAEQTENPKMRAMLYKIRHDVESGKQFSEALASHPKQFSKLYVNMVRASEMSGSFSQMLDRIAAYLNQQIETRTMVIGAMIYPGVIAFMAIGVTVFLLTVVLPQFKLVFDGKEAAMPWVTRFLMGLSDFMVMYWWAVGAAGLAIVGGILLSLRTTQGVKTFDALKLRVPVFKKMFRALYLSRSLHTMGELINAGVPMLDTLQITAEISGNYFFRHLWYAVYGSVKQGKKLAQPMQRSNLLPKAVTQMISAGEESGKLGEVLTEVSEYYSKQLREAIKMCTAMIEPLMIVVMGSIVGFIAMAIILPIFRMSTMVN